MEGAMGGISVVSLSGIPAGAVIHMDFLGGVYYANGAIRTIDYMLTGDPILDADGADLSGVWFPSFTADLRTQFSGLQNGSGYSIRAEVKVSSFAETKYIYRYNGTAEFDAGIGVAGQGKLRTIDLEDGATTSNAVTLDVFSAIGITFIKVVRQSVCIDGGTVATATAGTSANATSIHFGHNTNSGPIGKIRVFTVFPPVADAALPALSTI